MKTIKKITKVSYAIESLIYEDGSIFFRANRSEIRSLKQRRQNQISRKIRDLNKKRK